MLVHQQPEAVTARQGRLDGARVWREPVLGDDRVFLRQDQEPKPGFSVDLLLDGSASRALYGREMIVERHRHRYEFNNKYKEALEKAGLKAVGVNPERDLVEIVELEGHPWFVGCQFHPEFKSRPNRPHPLFSGFVGAAIEHKG